jgi:hypothetical protein
MHIITGLNGGAIYQNFPQPTFGAWNQPLYGEGPYHYMIGNQQYNISPRPPGNQIFFPYIGPNSPTTF